MAAASVIEYQEAIKNLTKLLDDILVMHKLGPFEQVQQAKELLKGEYDN